MPYKPSPSEPIAIVASSCRFTGGATSPSKLWDLLKEPFDLTRPVPASRFNIHAFYHPEGDYHGTTDAPNAYWLDSDQDPRAFDAGFFGIAPKEAEAVDPQQRLLLETVYEALESAGYRLPEWTGQNVAVYVGAMTSDYDCMSQRDDLSTSPYYATGNAGSILANRISYFFDFHGPSATIDTACSSSLVALHQAVLSLRAGDCSAACVAGVNLMLAPEQFVAESSLHMLSPTGHCHMWDTRADGYARGEGAAVLLLKPLRQALADGDASRIQGIVRETGVGSDGRTSGITMPSPEAQAALVRSTYARAGLDLADAADRCQYFEAHGTGTPVGDPREAQAIYSAFFGRSSPHDKDDTMLVGSVKTVIGHTEGAAGLAGMLKVMLAMKHAQVPPNLHMRTLNPSVAPFCTPSTSSQGGGGGHLEVVSQLQAWPDVAAGQPRRASVNSFGFGGTNAHAIVEHYDPAIHTPDHPLPQARSTLPPPVLDTALPHIPLLLSATSSSSLRALAQKYLDYLQTLQDDSSSSLSLQEVAWRMAAARTTFIQRIAISAPDRRAAIDVLAKLVSTAAISNSAGAGEFGVRARRIDAPLQLIGIFTGQGAQWVGMSKHLLATSRIYRSAIQSMDAVLQSCPHPPDWSLEAELDDENGARVHEAALSQPLCTAVQVGLVAVLARLGLRLAAVVGHSSGEIAAAHAAGRISARDAILIAYYRGLSVSYPTQRQGGMVAAGLGYVKAMGFCEQFDGTLCVAASNAPSSTTLSGDVEAVERAASLLERDGIFARRLAVDKAYHSHHMADVAGIYAGYLDACQLSPRNCDNTTPVWISSVSPAGAAPTTEQLAGPYWADNLVQPVQFREAVATALALPVFKDSVGGAVEIGPHSALMGPFLDTYAEAALTRSMSSRAPPYKSLLRRGQRDDVALQDFVSFWSTHFDPSPISFRGLLSTDEETLLDSSLAAMHADDAHKLPAYVWDHAQTYARESRILRQFHHQTAPPHELLGTRTRDDVDGNELRWRNLLRVDKLPWLAHHAFQGQPLIPASAYCMMALDAAKVLLAGRAASLVELGDVEFVDGTPLDVDGPATEIMFSLMVQSPTTKMKTVPASVREPASARDEPEMIHARFSIYATAEASASPMRKRCSGRICIVLGDPCKDALPCRTDPDEQPETFPVPVDAFYDMMAAVGLNYSGPFRAIGALRRRYEFASARLPRFQASDTTGLATSPATLDACLQTCFATFSSPGDKALWTAFLPIPIKKVVFNLAHSGVAAAAAAAGPARQTQTLARDMSMLDVDAELTGYQEAAHNTPSRITGNILIYNDDGDMEVMVEGLTAGSFASSSDPGADRELYLHTTYAADPEHGLAVGTAAEEDIDDAADVDDDYRVLEESCERVAMFGNAASAWPSETKESLQQYILESPYSLTLEKMHQLKLKLLAPLDVGDAAYQAIIEEGWRASQFQRQLSRVVKQVAHRYPRMSVLSLTDADMFLAQPILRGLGEAFSSYTAAMVGEDAGFADHIQREQPAHVTQKITVQTLAREEQPEMSIKEALATSAAVTVQTPADLVVMSTSIFRKLESSEVVLAQIKELMRPGGFLFLVHMPPIKTASRQEQSPSELYDDQSDDALITPPDWLDLLEQSGFMTPAIENNDQHSCGGFFITVRQCASAFKKALASAAEGSDEDKLLEEKLLVIGGSTADTVSLAALTRQLVSQRLVEDATIVFGLDGLAALPAAALSSFTCAILLADLDDYQPILSTLTERRLSGLRNLLLVPGLTMLWVTKGARNGNAESAASYGFTRSVRAEIPSLRLQMLDFDHLQMVHGQLRAPCSSTSSTSSANDARKPLAASVIASHFFQFVHAAKQPPRADEDLWMLETELFIGCRGERLIPRLVPFRPANDNYNADRRIVATQVNTLSTCLEVVHDPLAAAAAAAATYTTRLGPSLAALVEAARLDTDLALVKVLYSTPDALFGGYCLCIGRDELSGNMVASMSRRSASFVSVRRQHTVPLGQAATTLLDANPGGYASTLTKMLACQAICQHLDGRTPLVLVAPDAALLRCARILASSQDEPQKIVSLQVETNKRCEKDKDTVYIHPRATPLQINAALRRFGAGTAFVDFLPRDHAIAQHVRTHLAAGCVYQSWNQIGKKCTSPRGDDGDDAAFTFLQKAVATANRQSMPAASPSAPELVSVSTLLAGSQHAVSSPLIVDWRADRTARHTERPLQDFSGRRNTDLGAEVALRADRTYVLVGITRDMGQSLATLFVRQGARHIVLASRTHVATQPQWAARLAHVYGAVVCFLALDVTDLAAVRRFRATVERDLRMPMVGGIVNGAMVLDDRVVTHMTADTFARVMRPKTVGSRNLDSVFHDDDADAAEKLDFFIMTSSFAAPGGHAGQSNYAAANMYMNGLAANRQRRGAAGSVLNIGVVYGLGFLHREKGELYAGLEREGYSPISERDLHHMFLEALRQGRPKTLPAQRMRPLIDLTTGLDRYDPEQPADMSLHWHRDPRFSHFTVRGGKAGAGSGKGGAANANSATRVLADMIEQGTAAADAVGRQLAVALIERLSALLHVEGSNVIHGDNTAAELGVDSLVAVEMRTWLWRTTSQDVPVMRILGAPSINQLCMDIGDAIVARRE